MFRTRQIFQVNLNMFIPSLRGRYLKRRGEKEPARCFPAPLTPTKSANMQTFLFFQKNRVLCFLSLFVNLLLAYSTASHYLKLTL